MFILFFFFFFSSRRRHTRWNCDWSSDVCSSDLAACAAGKSTVISAKTNLSVPASHKAGRVRLLLNTLTPMHESLIDVKPRSEEHTSELQSQFHLVCRLLLEKKKRTQGQTYHVKA